MPFGRSLLDVIKLGKALFIALFFSLLKGVIISITVLLVTRILLNFGAFLWKPLSLLHFLPTCSIFCSLPWIEFLFPSEAMEVVLAFQKDLLLISMYPRLNRPSMS